MNIEWIATQERLPETEVMVIWWNRHGYHLLAHLTNDIELKLVVDRDEDGEDFNAETFPYWHQLLPAPEKKD